jgi:hypothetical protein
VAIDLEIPAADEKINLGILPLLQLLHGGIDLVQIPMTAPLYSHLHRRQDLGVMRTVGRKLGIFGGWVRGK